MHVVLTRQHEPILPPAHTEHCVVIEPASVRHCDLGCCRTGRRMSHGFFASPAYSTWWRLESTLNAPLASFCMAAAYGSSAQGELYFFVCVVLLCLNQLLCGDRLCSATASRPFPSLLRDVSPQTMTQWLGVAYFQPLLVRSDVKPRRGTPSSAGKRGEPPFRIRVDRSPTVVTVILCTVPALG